ncbi:uncharacterized protein KY384_003964 [Bacidia gigantensis]|uniref:uncharacterized protein n=1 Tax=Bacidia gigantensis TaxID=2732470 RepID=UPI001D05905B|nr:uncharacterized protein KY384_003964 [Bacidia gigantensis]KAG8532323.1 hypothetical protein KY384_003964 [Bacidia gigantensis]
MSEISSTAEYKKDEDGYALNPPRRTIQLQLPFGGPLDFSPKFEYCPGEVANITIRQHRKLKLVRTLCKYNASYFIPNGFYLCEAVWNAFSEIGQLYILRTIKLDNGVMRKIESFCGGDVFNTNASVDSPGVHIGAFNPYFTIEDSKRYHSVPANIKAKWYDTYHCIHTGEFNKENTMADAEHKIITRRRFGLSNYIQLFNRQQHNTDPARLIEHCKNAGSYDFGSLVDPESTPGEITTNSEKSIDYNRPWASHDPGYRNLYLKNGKNAVTVSVEKKQRPDALKFAAQPLIAYWPLDPLRHFLAHPEGVYLDDWWTCQVHCFEGSEGSRLRAKCRSQFTGKGDLIKDTIIGIGRAAQSFNAKTNKWHFLCLNGKQYGGDLMRQFGIGEDFPIPEDYGSDAWYLGDESPVQHHAPPTPQILRGTYDGYQLYNGRTALEVAQESKKRSSSSTDLVSESKKRHKKAANKEGEKDLRSKSKSDVEKLEKELAEAKTYSFQVLSDLKAEKEKYFNAEKELNTDTIRELRQELDATNIKLSTSNADCETAKAEVDAFNTDLAKFTDEGMQTLRDNLFKKLETAQGDLLKANEKLLKFGKLGLNPDKYMLVSEADEMKQEYGATIDQLKSTNDTLHREYDITIDRLNTTSDTLRKKYDATIDHLNTTINSLRAEKQQIKRELDATIANSHKAGKEQGVITLQDLQRVERERDTAIANLGAAEKGGTDIALQQVKSERDAAVAELRTAEKGRNDAKKECDHLWGVVRSLTDAGRSRFTDGTSAEGSDAKNA